MANKAIPVSSAERVALYARVSSEQQAQENTIASQVEALRSRISTDGFTLDEELCFLDDGFSGSTLVRPALERLRDVAWSGGFQRLYVHSPDRLARKYAWQVLLLEELRRSGIELIFLNHTLGASPEEDLLLQMQGMIAEYERAKILERCRRGKRHAARSGSVNVLAGAPYGYRYITKQAAGGEAYYQVVFEQARLVQQMFEWVGHERVSLREVCRRVEKQGIPSPTGNSRWNPATVWGLLKNPAYRGAAAFGKTRIGERRPQLRPPRNKPEHTRRLGSSYDTPTEEQISIAVPALVSEELFAAVADQLEENRRQYRQQARGARYLLQGLLQCSCCGYAYYGKKVGGSRGKRPYDYYRCGGAVAYRFGGVRVCHNKQLRRDQLESAVWTDVCTILQNPRAVQQEFERRLERPQAEQGTLEQIRKQIATVQRNISRLIDAYADGLLEKSEFEPRIQKAKTRLHRFQQDANEAADRAAERQELRLVLGHLEAFAEQVRDGLQHADWHTRREIIRSLVKTVKIEDQNVRIIYRVSPRPFAESPARGAILQHCWKRLNAPDGVETAQSPRPG